MAYQKNRKGNRRTRPAKKEINGNRIAGAKRTRPPKRTKPTKEEILEKKITMAKERGSRVMKINSPMGSIMFNVLRQFDQAYANFKGQLGEPGGISYQEGAELMEKAREITVDFSQLTKKLSRNIGFRYFTPEELKMFEIPLEKTKSKKTTNSI